MNKEIHRATSAYVTDFVHNVETLNPRFVGVVDESLAHFYSSKGMNPLAGATLYVSHRPKVAE